MGIHSVSKGRQRVDRLFGDPPGSPFEHLFKDLFSRDKVDLLFGDPL